MKIEKFCLKVFTCLVLVSSFLLLPSQVAANWGMDVGRANEGDLAELLSDQLALKMAHNRINAAAARTVVAERKLVLLGKSTGR